MKDRGSALLTAVIAVTVLLMISGALLGIVNYQYRLESSEEKGLRAYYLAEAGTNYGIAVVKSDVETKHNTTPPTPSPYDTVHYTKEIKDNTMGANYPGVFDVEITIDKADIVRTVEPPLETITSASYVLTVESTGYYPDKQGIKRTLTEQYTFSMP